MSMRNPTPRAPRLGIDFGRVIVDGSSEGDTPFIGVPYDDALEALPVPWVVGSVRELVPLFKETWIISKASATVQRKTLGWLDRWDFWETTGIQPWSICFTLKREQKVEVAKRLSLTHFIDDRLDVLETMRGVVPHLYWFQHDAQALRHDAQSAQASGYAIPDWYSLVDWKDLRQSHPSSLKLP